MNHTKQDQALAKANPWGLTIHQCAAMRLLCIHGSAKRATLELGIGQKTFEHHIHAARQKIGYRGADVRHLVAWVGWLHRYRDELSDVLGVRNE